MNNEIGQVLAKVRSHRPLIQVITNYVTINDCANILLGFGASPAMCEARDEVEEFAAVVQGLYLNLGTLVAEQREAMNRAALVASRLGTPIVLDPVAAGGISGKTDFAHSLLAKYRISIVKGNLGEIKALAGFDAGMRGVDSADDGENIVAACNQLAQQYQTVVVATGTVDTISDGRRTVRVYNGHELLTRITGAGCMAGALVAAAAAVEKDHFLAAVAGVTALGVAAEMAASDGMGPGTFRVELFDNIYALTEADIKKAGRIEWL